jgi:hypothetical protein
MIQPEAIPRIDGDMMMLAAHADALRGTGIAIADTGTRVHQAWQELATVYLAPEADQLLAATGPVMSISASVGEDIQAAAAALNTYATDAADIQFRLDVLRLRATDLAEAYTAAQDESTTVALDDRSAELSAAVAAQIEAWEAAQLRCANALRGLIGAPPLAGYTSAASLAQHGGAITITPRGPTGPLQEIFPTGRTPPTSSTRNPPTVFGPGLLITVPAPPTTGIVDGPGSYRLPFGPDSIFHDRSTDGTDAENPPAVEPTPALTPPQRLDEVYRRLGELPPATSAEEALDNLARTLEEVEDEHSGVPKNPNPGLAFDGRMYPPREDFIDHLPDGGLIATTKGNVIYAAPDGDLRIVSRRTGEELYHREGHR